MVENLFQSICRDPRHHQVLRFQDATVERPHFSEWSMKYVHKHSEISSLFSRFGLGQFEPHALQQEQLSGFLSCSIVWMKIRPILLLLKVINSVVIFPILIDAVIKSPLCGLLLSIMI